MFKFYNESIILYQICLKFFNKTQANNPLNFNTTTITLKDTLNIL